MPKIVLNKGVLKGRHAYSEVHVGVGYVYECVKEANNALDVNSFVVRNEDGLIIGHAPKEVSVYFQCIFENKKDDITIFW